MSRYRGPRLRILKRLGSLPGFGYKLNQKFLEQKKDSRNENSSQTSAKKKKKKSPYRIRLREKQKLRYNYGLTEKNLMQYVKKARQKKISTGAILLNNLEMRLDNIVFKLGIAPTIPAARQLVTHGHIFLNGKKRSIPSSQCKINDFISLNPSKNLEDFSNQSNKFKYSTNQSNKLEYSTNQSNKLEYSRNQSNKLEYSRNQSNKLEYSRNQSKEKIKITNLSYTFPKFLTFDSKNVTGKILRYATRKELDLNINELLVIEYYSRNL